MCIDTCIGMCVDMCIGMRIDICIGVCIGMCLDMAQDSDYSMGDMVNNKNTSVGITEISTSIDSAAGYNAAQVRRP